MTPVTATNPAQPRRRSAPAPIAGAHHSVRVDGDYQVGGRLQQRGVEERPPCRRGPAVTTQRGGPTRTMGVPPPDSGMTKPKRAQSISAVPSADWPVIGNQYLLRRVGLVGAAPPMAGRTAASLCAATMTATLGRATPAVPRTVVDAVRNPPNLPAVNTCRAMSYPEISKADRLWATMPPPKASRKRACN